METFKDQSWDERFEKMGDQAERQFEESHTNWARFGWDRPDIDMSGLPTNICYMPDYAWNSSKTGNPVLVEVQGCGRDQWFKFKEDKLFSLRWWEATSEMKVFVWLWNATNKRSFMVPLKELLLMLFNVSKYNGEHGTFPEGKEFVKFRAETFVPWEE